MAKQKSRIPCVYVLAGANGAGKSSIAGAIFLAQGTKYFNPDEAARRILAANPGITQQEANSAAWHQGRRLLERAISERLNFALETTLGGNSITGLLNVALSVGMEVRVWYVGLATVELHLARVRARVAKGGHDIPEEKIRERYDRSRLNLIALMPRLTELLVYDNSKPGDPEEGVAPEPVLLLHLARGKIVSSADLTRIPKWAKPILQTAFKRQR
ncbi:MAG TPA: zeta toxin family protein [Bryobacteraceae bacterium]|nr:zeta toxin family protein [Bryobacteraceae bacterium]